MNNLAIKTGELVDVTDLADTDIFQMLMDRDRVNKHDFLRLCADAKREIGQYRSSSAPQSVL